ncbi:C39 family peptidase [Streptomyces sp. NPDC091292]|uniref:C39 family peptidase n=1 Tax=Streptomyces sp. NPDC091292 TaxID=3365991 RepID=UPI003800E477
MPPPPCCADPRTDQPYPPHDPVPVVTQYASPELIGDIAYGGHDAADDPRWRESAAPTHNAYRRWCRHICGMACLRMILLHRDAGTAPNLFQLLSGARAFGAYTRDTDGIHGMFYDPFAAYAYETHDLDATVHREMRMDELLGLLAAGHMVMASVSKEIRRPHLTPPRRGGHLILATGLDDGHILFRNPSGHTPDTTAAALPTERFATFFAGRGISIDVSPTGRQRPAPHARTRQVTS